jgi:DNA-directed RNA polymerase subunit beta
MSKTQTVDKKIVARKFFNDDKEVMPMPELIEIQKDSYKWFLDEGLAELFDEINPIR